MAVPGISCPCSPFLPPQIIRRVLALSCAFCTDNFSVRGFLSQPPAIFQSTNRRVGKVRLMEVGGWRMVDGTRSENLLCAFQFNCPLNYVKPIEDALKKCLLFARGKLRENNLSFSRQHLNRAVPTPPAQKHQQMSPGVKGWLVVLCYARAIENVA